jgi:hypothetical protein
VSTLLLAGIFYFAGVVDLKAGNLFLSSCADCKKRIAKKRSVPRGIVAEKNRGDKIEHGQIARKDGQFSQI